ncbi:TPA: hypothetical protein N2R15_004083 [Citrobacter amalonaticus]|nr:MULTISPECIES: peptide IlvX [Citrobacter]EKV5657275.1 hypothetical protein [Citrobacter farmeri]EKW2928628.1 hypothetical protein [Citrobacter amalonaticus]EKZ2528505.1 hypothetical protein [Citrobacter farmeri]ELK6625834.1 hypothetical protein [Citrobacter amalonaticus]MBJ9260307.1 hypothetical protein [Citrobacter amalonaticus]
MNNSIKFCFLRFTTGN